MHNCDTFPVLTGAFAIAIAQTHTEKEIALLSAFFSQLSVSLALILTARNFESSNLPQDNTSNQASNLLL